MGTTTKAPFTTTSSAEKGSTWKETRSSREISKMVYCTEKEFLAVLVPSSQEALSMVRRLRECWFGDQQNNAFTWEASRTICFTVRETSNRLLATSTGIS